MSTGEDETMKTTTHRRPAVVSFIGLGLGIAASLAGNLQAINLDDARPGVGGYISATIWPLGLFVVIEIMLHTPWVRSWRDGLVKWVGLLGVAFIALYVSYGHLVHTLQAYNYDGVSSHVAPLAVDGMLAMATLSLNRVGQARRAPNTPTVQLPDTTPDGQYGRGQDNVYRSAGQEEDTINLANADELAHATLAEELGKEAEHYLSRLGRELDSTTTPAVPVIAGTLPQRQRVRRPGIEPELTELLTAWDTAGRPLSPGQVDMLLAAHHEISTRTVRRRREALGLI